MMFKEEIKILVATWGMQKRGHSINHPLPFYMKWQQRASKSICCPTFFSLLSSIGELAVPGVASPNKKHSLVISSWVEREEPSWGSTWRSGRHTHSGHTDKQANGNTGGQMKPPSKWRSHFSSARAQVSHSAASLVNCKKCTHPQVSTAPAALIMNAQTVAFQSLVEAAARGCVRLRVCLCTRLPGALG